MPDIFQLAEQKLREKESHSLNFDADNTDASDLLESVVLVCGSVTCGKTSLIQRFMETSQEDSKTLALEYRYASRMKNNKKEVASVWELGSGAKMAKLISTPLSSEFLESTSLLIFVDLTNPSQIPQMVFDIIQNVSEKTATILKIINNSNPERYDRLQKLMKKFADQKDASLMNAFPFPVTFIAARYDHFQNMESEKKKLIYKFIRYVAHINGANVMPFSTTAESLVAKCKTLLSCYAFHEAKPSIQQNTDIIKPLYMNAGNDSLESIGHITGAGIPPSNYKDAMNEWKDAFQENFPREDENKKQSSSTDIVEDKKFAEYEIDIAVEEKRRELEMFIREKKNRKALSEKSHRQNI